MIQLKRRTPLTTHQRTFRRHLLILAAVTFAVNLTGLIAEFTFDDAFIIVDNPRVHSLSNQKDIWLSGYWPKFSPYKAYRPLTIFTYALNWALHGKQPEGYHLVNTALYIGVILLFYMMLRRWLFVPKVAFWTALLFAVHPIHVEAVVGVVGRAELLCALFVLAGLYFDDRFIAHKSFAWRWMLASVACYGGALASKETAICFLGFLFLWDLFRFICARRASTTSPVPNEGHGLTWRMLAMRVMPRYACVLAVFGCFLMARYHAFEGDPATPAEKISKIDNPAAVKEFRESIPLRTALAFRIFGKYMQLVAIPKDLCPDYGYDGFQLTGASKGPKDADSNDTHFPNSNELELSAEPVLGGYGQIGVFVLVAMTAIVAWSLWRGSGFAALTVGWFFASYLLLSNTVILIPIVLAERAFFLPSIFIAVLVGMGIHVIRNFAQTKNRLQWINFALISAVILLATRTVFRNFDFMNNYTLFRSAVAVYPDGARIRNNFGATLDKMGFLDQAEEHYRHSLSVYGGFSPAFYGLGGLYYKSQQFPEAIDCLTMCLKADPYHHAAHYRLGKLYYLSGELELAMSHARRASAIRPDMPAYKDLVAILLNETGQEIASREQVIKRMAEHPEESLPHYLLGVFSEDEGDLKSALHHYRRAVKLDPLFADAQLQLARVAMLLRDQTNAKQAFTSYLELRPEDWETRLQFAQLLTISLDKTIRNLELALEQINRATDLAPGNLLVLSAKVEVLVEMDRRREAVQTLEQILNRLGPEAPTRFMFEKRYRALKSG